MRQNQLHIVIDGYNLSLEKGTGIATYARNLSFALRDIGARVDVLYGQPGVAHRNSLLQEISFFDPVEPIYTRAQIWIRRAARLFGAMTIPFGLKAKEVPITGRVITKPFENRLPYFQKIWNASNLFSLAHAYFFLYRRLLVIRLPETPSIVHWTYPVPIKVKGAKNIYTFHDLVPLRLPYTTLDKKEFYYRLVKQIATRADRIVTVSEASKRDICELLDIDSDRVDNTYQVVSIPATYMSVDQTTLSEILKGTFDLDCGKYFLFVGAIEPKKNVGRLIEAYLGSGVRIPLVMAGPVAWMAEKELALISDDYNKYLVQRGDETYTKGRIIQLDYVTFPQLMYLMQGARALLFPSLYEGFGLPVVEAMTLGTAVMTSNTSSLPEIAGDAAIMVDPYRVSEMRDVIKRLAADDGLVADLGQRGKIHAKRFGLNYYLERLSRVYSRCLSETSNNS